MKRYLRCSGLALAFLLAWTVQVDAQVKPFKISGSGIAPHGLPLPGQEAREHWILGNATHLGRHTGEGTVITATADVHLDPTTGAPTRITGTFGSGSPFTFRGANGDKLVCDYGRDGEEFTGTFELTVLGATESGLLVEALWVADFVPRPEESTGKFKGITGSWLMVAQSEPFVLGSDDSVYYSWEGDGHLTFARKK